jgi:hypothetical protein
MWRLFFVLTLACLVPSFATARTWYVTPDGGGDAPTIQAAIDSAPAWDAVVLADGLFCGPDNRDISLHGKAIIVRSTSNDPTLCTIDCYSSSFLCGAQGFCFRDGEGVASKKKPPSIFLTLQKEDTR